jgi:predicted ester cyclase
MRRVLLTVTSIVLIASGAHVADAMKKTKRHFMDRFFQVVDSKQLDKLAEVDAPDLDMIMPMGPVKGLEGHKRMLQGFGTAFPDFKHVTSRCVESGDLISCEGTFSGDHTGPMMMPDGKTLPATNKHVEIPYAGIARIKNGKVAELHVYFDNMSFMMQLGLLPQPKMATK